MPVVAAARIHRLGAQDRDRRECRTRRARVVRQPLRREVEGEGPSVEGPDLGRRTVPELDQIARPARAAKDGHAAAHGPDREDHDGRGCEETTPRQHRAGVGPAAPRSSWRPGPGRADPSRASREGRREALVVPGCVRRHGWSSVTPFGVDRGVEGLARGVQPRFHGPDRDARGARRARPRAGPRGGAGRGSSAARPAAAASPRSSVAASVSAGTAVARRPATPVTWLDGISRTPRRRRARWVMRAALTATRWSQASKRSGSRSLPICRHAVTNVSWAASRASASSPRIANERR